MIAIVSFPAFILVLSFLALWLVEWTGASCLNGRSKREEARREDFGVIVAATLTLLGLIIGFTFSMAISRYEQRKNDEAAEANAIGTEYVRADILPAADAARVRVLLRNYLNQRILFYEARDDHQLQQIDAATAALQRDLWSAVQVPASAQPTPMAALAASGMNDVLNSQGYTQAAWWNHIPIAAWGLMVVIAMCGNLLVGYGAERPNAKGFLFLVLPLIVAFSFFLIGDIDSPRRGLIRVEPQNLISLSQTLDKQ